MVIVSADPPEGQSHTDFPMLGYAVCKCVQWSWFWCFWWDFGVLVYPVIIHLCDYSFGDDKKLVATKRVGQSGTTSTGLWHSYAVCVWDTSDFPKQDLEP